MGRFLATLFVIGSIGLVLTFAVACAVLFFNVFLYVVCLIDSTRPDVVIPSLALTWLLVVAILLFSIVPFAFLVQSTFEGPVGPSAQDSERRRWKDWNSAKIAVALTAFNDEASIGESVQDFIHLRRVDTVYVIDNNSIDSTRRVAESAGAVVVTESTQGYGRACIRGLRECLNRPDCEIVVLAEGDMTFFGEDIEKLVPYLQECDMVVGTRTTMTLTRAGSQMDWFMVWGNIYLAFLIRLRFWNYSFLGSVQLTDVGCTFRAIRRVALQRIINELTVGGHYFSPHMILVALTRHLSVIEVPIKFRERKGVSKGAGGNRIRAIRVGFQMMYEILSRGGSGPLSMDNPRLSGTSP